MRFAAYCRVSTADQVDGFSLSAQTRAIRAYADSQGWTFAGEYVDEGVSAAKESAALRPAFRRLMADVEAKRIDVVVVHKLDRFSRNVTVTLQSLGRIHNAGATFVAVSEHIDFTTPSGRLMLTMLAAFAAFYSDNLATEVSKGRSERAAQGLWNGDLPFGYLSTGDARKAPVIVPEEAGLVRGAFELYAGGTVSAHEVASWLNEQGARPRSKRNTDARFTKATVTDMLSNPFYCGRLRYRGEEMAGQHEAIVPVALFEQVQTTKTSRRRLGAAVRERLSRTFLLRGIARCAACGELLWCSPSSRGDDRYRDASKLKQRPCTAHVTSVAVGTIDSQVGQMVRRMTLPDDWQNLTRSFIDASPEAATYETEKRRIEARLERERLCYLDGDTPRGEYNVIRAKLRAELESLTAPHVADAMAESGSLMERLALQWDAAEETERAALVQAVFAEVYINLDARRIECVAPRPQFRPLFDLLRAECVVSGDPERLRIDHTQLFSPVMALVEAGSLYRPAELVSAVA